MTDPSEVAESAGLVDVCDEDGGIRRELEDSLAALRKSGRRRTVPRAAATLR